MTRATSFSVRVPRALAWLVGALLVLCAAWPGVAAARDVPPLVAHVNDTAGMLSDTERAALEGKLTAYEQKTGSQFALLTIDTLAGDALEDFSIRVVEAWKLGKKGKDDGLLLLVVKADHHLRIEVGYGLEGTITDAFSSRVIRNTLTPAFRANQVAQGLDLAFDQLMQQASGEAVQGLAPAPATDPEDQPESPLALLLLLLFIGGPLLVGLIANSGRRGGWGGGGFGGGGFGGFGGGGFGGGGSSGGGGGFSGGGGGFGGGGSSGSW